MLGLVNLNDIWDVLNVAQDPKEKWLWEGPTKRFISKYRQRPSFFTPFKNKSEFIGSFLANFIYPAALTITSFASAVCAVLGLTLGVVATLVAVVAAIMGNHQFCDDSIDNTKSGFRITGLALASLTASIFLFALSLIHTPINFLTRTVATLICDYAAPIVQPI
ncbi:MAG: hypothetical protein J0I93_14425 [Legionella sp.]|nr:hypothetical protein [Legionella sp.]